MILKNAGTFKILNKTDNVIENIATAARTCYKSESTSEDANIKLVKKLIERGHEAMLEFADITVKFDNISRGFSHEMVRHRLASFAQESTRYVGYKDGIDFIVSPNTKDSKEDLKVFTEATGVLYNDLLNEGEKPEDARQFLPIGIKTSIVVKANIREWRQIFSLRCDKPAHWEIRGVMVQLLLTLQEAIPIVFDDFTFFDSEAEKQYCYMYARKIIPQKQLEQRIRDFIKTGGILDLVEITKD